MRAHRYQGARPRGVCLAAAGTLSVVAAVAIATIASVSTTAASAGTPSVRKPTTTTLAYRGVAPGVLYRRARWSASAHREHSGLLTVDLTNPHVRLGTHVPKNVLNSDHQRVSTMLSREVKHGGIAAVNASFYNLTDHTLPPAGGVVAAGTILKSPHLGALDNFYVRSDGSAGIGPVSFVGSVSTTKTDGTPSTRTLWSVNLATDALKGHLALLTSSLDVAHIPAGCTVATVAAPMNATGALDRQYRPQQRGWTLRVPARHVAMVGCGKQGSWLASLPAGHLVRTSGYLVEGTNRTVAAPSPARRISTLVTGAEQLVDNGLGILDTSDHNITGRNAETFACVSRDARHVVLGTVDQYAAHPRNKHDKRGRQDYSRGVTMRELRRFTLKLGCYDALALDGGGSTALDYRPRGTHGVRHGNHPRGGYQRHVPVGLYVAYH